jgi:flagellin FlaB
MGKKLKLRKNNFGAIGIGTMIIFIAMVLVAGIAASVLIQTASKLETQAMITGQETTAEVATGLAVADVEGFAATDSDISRLAIQVRSRAGSSEIDLSEMVIEISDSDNKLVLKYTADEFTLKDSIDGDIFNSTFYTTMEANEFSVIVLEDADGSCSATNPIINSGDKVILSVYVGHASGFNSIPERSDVWGSIMPEEGAPGVVAFRTPASYTTNIMDLQ